MKRLFPFFGHNKYEFRDSVAIVLVGFVVMFFFMPPQAYESNTPEVYYKNYGAARLAGLFVFALIGLLCSINACRDKNATQIEKQRIFVWSWILGIWTCVLFLFLIRWWQELDSILKPSWFQSG